MIYFSEAPVTSYWISHIVCFVFLVLLNSSNSILVRGVYIDAEEDGTQCVDFPCYYVRLLVQVSNTRSLIFIVITVENLRYTRNTKIHRKLLSLSNNEKFFNVFPLRLCTRSRRLAPTGHTVRESSVAFWLGAFEKVIILCPGVFEMYEYFFKFFFVLFFFFRFMWIQLLWPRKKYSKTWCETQTFANKFWNVRNDKISYC